MEVDNKVDSQAEVQRSNADLVEKVEEMEKDITITNSNINANVNNAVTNLQTFENLPEENLKKLKYGDFVIVYESRDILKYFILERGKVFQNKYGAFKHDEMYGQSFGTKIYSSRGTGYITILDFIPHLWERCINRLTQILFNPDISTILTFLDIRSDSIIYESGTGSGCLSTNITQVLNEGHLYTFEFNKERAEKLKSTFKFVGLDKKVTVIHRDVIEGGFLLDINKLHKPEDAKCDGIFIDLPSPWMIIEKAKAVLKTGGNFVSFSPCIEQIDQTMKALREYNFINPRMFECSYRNFNYSRAVKVNMPILSAKRKFGQAIPTEEKEMVISNSRSDMRGHTGYLIYAINS